MKILTDDEVKFALDKGAGLLHFFTGVSSTNGQEILLVEDKALLFEKDEINNEEYKQYKQLMDIEAEAYANCLAKPTNEEKE